MEREGSDGEGADEIFHVGRHQAEEGSEIPGGDHGGGTVGTDLQKRRRFDHVQAVSQKFGIVQDPEEGLRLWVAENGEPDKRDAEHLPALRKQPLEEFPDSPADDEIRLDLPEFTGELVIHSQDVRIIMGFPSVGGTGPRIMIDAASPGLPNLRRFPGGF
jgi:hypothetical protein